MIQYVGSDGSGSGAGGRSYGEPLGVAEEALNIFDDDQAGCCCIAANLQNTREKSIWAMPLSD